MVCGASTTIFSGDGWPVASNGHRCRSAAIAGSWASTRPTSSSPKRPVRGKNSTLGSTDQAHTPLDAEHGPGWHLAVLPFTDGGTGVSLVVAHSLIDGVGLALALVEATSGVDDAIIWPRAGSRRRWRALREDARQTARDIPAVGRATRAAIRMARRHRRDAGIPARAPKHIERPDERITLPSATAFIDASEWDARAQSLGGTSNALLAGLAAEAAQRMGRVTVGDGAVVLSIPVNERTDGDTRANAVTNVDVTVDPTNATADLRGIRAAIKQALIHHNGVPDERLALLPIVPLVPKRLMRRMVSVATGNAASVVSSNLGEVPSAVTRPDGTDADYCTARSVYPGVTRATMHRTGGVLGFISGRVNGKVAISVLSYQPGRSQLGCRTAEDAFEHICRLFAQRDDAMEVCRAGRTLIHHSSSRSPQEYSHEHKLVSPSRKR